jgi:NADH-quinone oxidoreductase subunit J
MTTLLVPLVSGGAVAFWICGPIMVAAALGMILFRKAVYSALSLALVMVNLAIIYASQDAPFLFVVQIIVYTGAIMMLFLFVVMLVGVDNSESMVEKVQGHTVASVLAAVGAFVLLASFVGSSLVSGAVGVEDANATYGGNVQGLAALLFGKYVFAFEATAALLITAAVGAMVLAYAERLKPKLNQKARAKARIQDYAANGVHPGPRPSSGVYARHNAITSPALLPDGTVSQDSVSAVLVQRSGLADAESLSAPAKKAFAALDAPQGADEEEL